MKTKELLKKYAKRYFIDAMSAMALGLFASLLIGTIFNAIGMIPGLSVMSTIGKGAQGVAGAAMAVAIALSLKADPLVVFTCAAVGQIANTSGGAGGPLAVLFIAIISAEVGMLVSKKTKVDILVTPFVTLLVGGLLGVYCAPYIGQLVGYVSNFIGWATTQQPFLMGIIVSVLVGVALTLPISSAAICAALGLTGLAGGLLSIGQTLNAIMPVWELDSYTDKPFAMMQAVPGDTLDMDYVRLCSSIVGRDPGYIERFAFYEKARKAYAIIHTGETRKYGNILLQKGVIPC